MADFFAAMRAGGRAAENSRRALRRPARGGEGAGRKRVSADAPFLPRAAFSNGMGDSGASFFC